MTDVNGRTDAPAGLMGSLFAVMTSDMVENIVATAVLLDRKRDLLVSTHPVPDRVLLRPMSIETMEGVIFLEEHVFLNEYMACQAHAVFHDETHGLALLFAPGINHMLSMLGIPEPSSHFDVTSGPANSVAAAFMPPDVIPDESRDQASDFFYATALTVEATQADDGEMALALSDNIPENLPGRLPLFSEDGEYLLGIRMRMPENDHNLLSRNEIDAMVRDAGLLLDEAHENYRNWRIRLDSFVATLAAEDLPQHLELASSAQATLLRLEEKGYVLTIDMDSDGVPDLASPLDHPGLLIRIQETDNWTRALRQDIGR